MKQTTQTQRNNTKEVVEFFEAKSKRMGFEIVPKEYPKIVNRIHAQFMKNGRIDTYEERKAQVEKEREYYNVTGEIQ